MDKDVVHIYNGHYSAIKRNKTVSFAGMQMDLQTIIQTEVREKQILSVNTCMQSPEKWYRWSFVQTRNRDTDVENKHMDNKGKKERWTELGVGWD